MFITSKNKYLSKVMKIFGTCSIPLNYNIQGQLSFILSRMSGTNFNTTLWIILYAFEPEHILFQEKNHSTLVISFSSNVWVKNNRFCKVNITYYTNPYSAPGYYGLILKIIGKYQEENYLTALETCETYFNWLIAQGRQTVGYYIQ